MRKFTKFIRKTRKYIPISKAGKEKEKAGREKVKSIFANISSLPNELVIPILRNIYPLEIFIPYNQNYNKDAEKFWRDVLEADKLTSAISGINERFHDLLFVILKELVSVLGFKGITLEPRRPAVQPLSTWKDMVKIRGMVIAGRPWRWNGLW